MSLPEISTINFESQLHKVSVIIPTYNSGQYIRQAIDSVLAQTYQDFEIIVVDDGSTDNTADLLNPYQDRIRYIYQENKRLSGARNTGIRIAQGEYLAFLDADDIFLPHKLETQVKFFLQNPQIGLVSGGWVYMDSNSNILREARPWDHTPRLDRQSLLYICPFLPNSVLLRRRWVDLVDGFDESLQHVEDWDLWLRLVSAGCLMAWQREVVCHYRLHQMSQSRDGVGVKRGFLDVLDRFFSRAELDDPVQGMKNSIYAEALLSGFTRESAYGQIMEANTDLIHAVELNPELATSALHRILGYIASTADSPLVDDPGKYINFVVDNLPNELSFLRSKRNVIRAMVLMSRFYAAHAEQNWLVARRTYPAAVTHDPRWLANRGALRMWLDTVIGRGRVDHLRRLAGRPGNT